MTQPASRVTAPEPQATHGLPLYIVINVASGSGDGQRNHQLMHQVLRDAGRDHEFLQVHDPSQLGRVAARAARLAADHAGAVVVAGGDGTINTVAQTTLDSGRPLGIIPQGTFNYTGRAHAIPEDAAAATRALLDARPTRMQVGLVNQRVFLVNASLGLYPQLMQDREHYKRQFGRHRAVAFGSALATIAHGNGLLNLDLELDQVRQRVQTPALFIGNNALQLEQTGLPEAEVIGAQRLAGVILRQSGPAALLSLLLRGALGQLAEAESLHHFNFSHMRVQPAVRGVRKLKIALDGEVLWMKPPLTFGVSPQPLWLLTPRHGEQPAQNSA